MTERNERDRNDAETREEEAAPETDRERDLAPHSPTNDGNGEIEGPGDTPRPARPRNLEH